MVASRASTLATSALVMAAASRGGRGWGAPRRSSLADPFEERVLVDHLEPELARLLELRAGPRARHHQRHLLRDPAGDPGARRLGTALRLGTRHALQRA